MRRRASRPLSVLVVFQAAIMRFLRSFLGWLKANTGWLRWCAALAMLVFLAVRYQGDIARLFDEQPDWAAFAIAFLLCVAAVTLAFVRWYFLVRAQGFDFELGDALRLGLIGHAFNYVAPGSAGGDLFRALLIANTQDNRRLTAASTVIVDRLIGVVTLFGVGAFASLGPVSSLWQHDVARVAIAVLWAGAVVGFAGLILGLFLPGERLRSLERIVRMPIVAGVFEQLIDSLILYQRRRRVVALGVAISVVSHVVMLSSFYFCSVALHLGEAAPGFWMQLVLIPGAELAAVVVPVPGGVGALEAAVTFCYQISNEAVGGTVEPRMAQAAGLLVGLSFRVIGVAIAVMGMAVYLTTRSKTRRTLRERAAADYETDPPGGEAG